MDLSIENFIFLKISGGDRILFGRGEFGRGEAAWSLTVVCFFWQLKKLDLRLKGILHLL
jgi:hypothetical protein